MSRSVQVSVGPTEPVEAKRSEGIHPYWALRISPGTIQSVSLMMNDADFARLRDAVNAAHDQHYCHLCHKYVAELATNNTCPACDHLDDGAMEP